AQLARIMTESANNQIQNRSKSVLIVSLPLLRILISHITTGLQRFSSAVMNDASQNRRKLL
ncbi:MAG: hypothetical protein KGL31_07680, partial [candidate division NC10 bacterium]|nr:hypothetical protein [candidate division NC10 bacterium]